MEDIVVVVDRTEDGRGAQAPASTLERVRVSLSGPAGPLTIALVGVVLAALIGGHAFHRSSLLNPIIYNYYAYGVDKASGPNMVDALFDADIPQASKIMTDAGSVFHHRTSRHPWMSVALYPGVKALRIVGFEPVEAIRIFTAASAALWALLAFALFAAWRMRTFDCAVFTLLGATSASGMIWLPVPEVYVLGSATLFAGLLLTMWPARVPPVIRYSAAMALTLSMTVTNSLSSLVSAALRIPFRQLWAAGASAFFLVTVVWALGASLLFPESRYFMAPNAEFAAKFLVAPTPNRLVEVVSSVFTSTMVMPPISVTKSPDQWLTTVQGAYPWQAGPVAAIAVVAWLLMLGLAFVVGRKETKLWWPAALSLGALFALHSVFGFETFLFSLHFLPFLLVMTGAVCFTRWRRPVLALAAVVIVLGGWHNWRSFQQTVDILNQEASWAASFPNAQPGPVTPR
jgi:hypothetical protein